MDTWISKLKLYLLEKKNSHDIKKGTPLMVVAYSAVLLCLKRAWASWLGFILFRPKNVKPCRSSQEHPIAQEDFHVDLANVA